MKSNSTDPKFKVISSRVSYTKVDEPISIYDFSDIIDTDEQSNFQIDHSAYSEEIQQRFLHSPSFLLTTGESTKGHLEPILSKEEEEKYPSTAEIIARFKGFEESGKQYFNTAPPIKQKDSDWRQQTERIFKPSVLRHRPGGFLADQFMVQKPPQALNKRMSKNFESEKAESVLPKAVPLGTLLQMIVPKPGYLPSNSLLFNCLLMIRQYISMCDLMQHFTRSFLAACNQASRMNGGARSPVSIPVQIHCTLFIIFFWIRKMPYDFRCSNLMQKTRELFALCVNKYPPCFVEVRLALRGLYKQLKRLEDYEKKLERQNLLRLTDLNKTITAVCPEPARLAEQLLLLELKHLSYIGPEEYVQYLNAHKRIKVVNKTTTSDYPEASDAEGAAQNTSANRNPSQTVVHMKKDAHISRKFTFNLEAYIRWVNRLSYYITTEIVRHPKRKIRAAHIEYFIDVAERSLELNNFNSTLGVISGIDDGSVRRLRRTWQRVSNSHQTRFRYFQSLMSVSSNFATYRSAVANVLNKSKPEERFYIPFLCVSLKDIYYINEVMPDTVSGGVVNLEKIEKIGSLVAELMRLGKTVHKRFRIIEDIVQFLNATPVFDSATAMQKSMSYEGEDDR